MDPQHWFAQVEFGSQTELRNYAQMTARHEISGNVRSWNNFVLTDTVPANGQLALTVTVQSNWSNPGVDFFLDGFRVSQAAP
jgi:hypothetical protein